MWRNGKRSVFLILLCFIGVGCLTFILGESYPASLADGVMKLVSKGDKEEATDMNIDTTPSPDPTATPTISPTPTPLPVYEMEKGGNADIESFFQNYYFAKSDCDHSQLKNMHTDPENAQTLLDLRNETRFLDDIINITCYIIKSYEEGAYIVYAYHEMKYINIETPYPQLDKFYLITDKDNNLKIYNSDMSKILQNYYNERDKDEEVNQLITNTKKKTKKAIEKDENLKAYIEALNKN
ncbi:hypothetical protein [Herbinix luporum]|jgi:hypothetical protein|uniref:Uncharacterized protein n=1 Tax=Herbinix luporum TaxID=1679721 RepID=A0A0K8J5N4_9FIRM|nr:hypothetical protein [Herbinix luporum]MDI9489190.1 hypothetical protein [Bacillota bacterium]CUH92638.1 hypothetical protein SD1D_1092 [Herbinix luporum]HHT56724.1 hypothetical protein [Herbinix luporum]